MGKTYELTITRFHQSVYSVIKKRNDICIISVIFLPYHILTTFDMIYVHAGTMHSKAD